MKRLLLSTLALSACLAASAQFDSAPAFPGAEGFARYVTGGRGGDVYHVTSLADDGSVGTLRWAVNKAGKRTIVFDVDGTIYLTSALEVSSGNVSILGQTAPGAGICIADYPFTINSDNVILRFLRFRLGNQHVDEHEGDGLGSMDQNNIIVDHCSVSWSIDECLSVYGGKNLTVQWCMVDESLVNSGHSKGSHGYGGNWGGSGASYHHNIVAHHTSRTPRLGPRTGTQTDERMDMRNNVIYNWGGNGCYGGEGMNVNIVNNYYKVGPATTGLSPTKQKRIAAIGIRTTEYTAHDTDSPNSWDVMWHVWGKYYVDGNVNSKYSDVTNDNWTYGIYNQIDNSSNDGTYTSETKDTMKLDSPIDFGYVTTHSASDAYTKVVKYAGASHYRDAHDDVIAYDIENSAATYTGTGNSSGFVNSQDDAGGWPDLASGEAKTDTDGDGMPDEWETLYGLDPNNAADRNYYNLDSKRYYTNLEVYAHSLVDDIIKAQNADSDTSAEGAFEEYYPDYAGSAEDTGDGDEADASSVIYYHTGTNANQLTFDDGATLAITGNTAKTLDKKGSITYEDVSYPVIQNSNGAQMTFTCPTDMYATKVTIISTVKTASTTRNNWWKEVAGVTYEYNDETAMQAFADTENPDIFEYALDNVSSFTFTNSGDQTLFILKVEYASSTGVTLVETDGMTRTTPYVYTLGGQRVSRGNLSKGVYIVNGKKVIVN